jgi:hypothetical protein
MQHPMPSLAPRVNPYLPASLKGRGFPLFVLLYMFIFGPALITLFAVLMDASPVFVALFVVSLLANIAAFFTTIIRIFMALATLRGKYQDALNGNADAVLSSAHGALRWVFRGDIRLGCRSSPAA